MTTKVGIKNFFIENGEVNFFGMRGRMTDGVPEATPVKIDHFTVVKNFDFVARKIDEALAQASLNVCDVHDRLTVNVTPIDAVYLYLDGKLTEKQISEARERKWIYGQAASIPDALNFEGKRVTLRICAYMQINQLVHCPMCELTH